MTVVLAATVSGAAAAPASALNPLKPVCGAAGLVSGIVGKACSVVQHAGRIASAGKKLLTGHLRSAVSTAFGSPASTATSLLGLAAVGAWVLDGAKFVLQQTSNVLAETTSPRLTSTWFSAAYWRMAGIAAMLTLPFLFAAAVQALMHSDLSLLARAALGYLPLAMLAVSVAAPLTMLMLAASDQLSAVVSAASGHASTTFLTWASGAAAAASVLSRSPFVAFLLGVVTVIGALALWMELLMREAAVYVIVLMLPLAFAALVWPARRVWAVRAVELLVALILSKFAIVAVLSLGGAALEGSLGGHSIAGALAGFVLVVLAAFSPWALMRLLPLAELAGGAAGSLRGNLRPALGAYGEGVAAGHGAENWAAATARQMRREASAGADEAAQTGPADEAQGPAGEALGPDVEAGEAGEAATTRPEVTSEVAGAEHSAAVADGAGGAAPDTEVPASEAAVVAAGARPGAASAGQDAGAAGLQSSGLGPERSPGEPREGDLDLMFGAENGAWDVVLGTVPETPFWIPPDDSPTGAGKPAQPEPSGRGDAGPTGRGDAPTGRGDAGPTSGPPEPLGGRL